MVDTVSYLPSGREKEIFAAAWRRGLPVLLKGPTGCGKTRFVQTMARELGRSLHTVACHEDLTAGDLVGRYLLKGGEVGSSRVDLQACKLEYSIVSPK